MNQIKISKNHWGQYVIFIQAILALLGSLYFQYLGDPIQNVQAGNLFASVGGGFMPCILCRWARVLMYPIVWFVGISLTRRARNIVHYIFPISIAGIVLETYHYILQKTDWLDAISGSTFCTRANPCNALQVNYLGFITIPFLCLIAFVVIFLCCIAIKRNLKKMPELHHTHL